MVSLHALRHAYGADSEQLLAAKAGMVRMLQLIVQRMGAKFNGDIIYTVRGGAGVGRKRGVYAHGTASWYHIRVWCCLVCLTSLPCIAAAAGLDLVPWAHVCCQGHHELEANGSPLTC